MGEPYQGVPPYFIDRMCRRYIHNGALPQTSPKRYFSIFLACETRESHIKNGACFIFLPWVSITVQIHGFFAAFFVEIKENHKSPLKIVEKCGIIAKDHRVESAPLRISLRKIEKNKHRTKAN